MIVHQVKFRRQVAAPPASTSLLTSIRQTCKRTKNKMKEYTAITSQRGKRAPKSRENIWSVKIMQQKATHFVLAGSKFKGTLNPWRNSKCSQQQTQNFASWPVTPACTVEYTKTESFGFRTGLFKGLAGSWKIFQGRYFTTWTRRPFHGYPLYGMYLLTYTASHTRRPVTIWKWASNDRAADQSGNNASSAPNKFTWLMATLHVTSSSSSSLSSSSSRQLRSLFMWY